MTLALVIPVWNDLPGLTRLLDQARGMGCFDQVLVIDDASDPPIAADMLCRDWPADTVRVHRSPERRGAGAARNMALKAVTTDHVLFFDSDDLLTPELPGLWHDLRGHDFDFCLFRHHDSRVGQWGRWGQMPADDAQWYAAGMMWGRLRTARPDQAALLAETTNYPWNKIYRTAFLRAHDIRCSETMVHNDMELHWLSFLYARDILVSDRIGACHYVHGDGTRLTNRRGIERFSVFDTLTRILARMQGAGLQSGADLRLPCLRYASTLFDWIAGGLEPDLKPRFETELRHFLLEHVSPDAFARIARTDPLFAWRLNQQLAWAPRRRDAA